MGAVDQIVCVIFRLIAAWFAADGFGHWTGGRHADAQCALLFACALFLLTISWNTRSQS